MFKKEISINTLQAKIKAITFGEPKSEPILCFHGWQDNAASFIPLAQKLEQYYVIAVDLPGHGKSSHISEGSFYHFIDGVAIIYSIIKHLKLDKPKVIAHSMGAAMTLLTAGTFPKLFDKIVVIENLGPFSRVADENPQYTKTAIESLLKISKQKRQPSFPILEDLIKLRFRVGDVSLAGAKLLMVRGSYKKNNRIYLRRDPRLKIPSALRMNEKQVYSYLRKIESNVLLIEAKDGLDYDQELIKKRIEKFKNIQVKKLEGKHHLHMDEPLSVAKEITDFFKRDK